LILDKNFLDGPIPECISQWTNLETLSISDNKFTGPLPSSLGQLTKLTKIYVDGNLLTGDPTSILNTLVQLEIIYMEKNTFVGTIDDNFMKGMVALRALDLSSNNFTSTAYGIPTHFFSLPELVILDLSNNQLQGLIPENIPENDKLIFLSVQTNLMSGGIPGQLVNLTSLQHLDLSNNRFHGPLRSELFQSKSLYNMFFSENPLLHAGPIPNGIANMTQLREISFKNTNRTGALPDFPASFEDLYLLDLENNHFTGAIPASYGQLPTIRHLLLNHNNLTGAVPVFNGTNNLGTVILDGNAALTGDFTSMCNLPTFSGKTAIVSDLVAVVDCDGSDDTTVVCPCCYCCAKAKEFCSELLVASLDWTWEEGWSRSARDFGFNLTDLIAPSDPPP
jgi:Leucine-rich repeat (LRR) protein